MGRSPLLPFRNRNSAHIAIEKLKQGTNMKRSVFPIAVWVIAVFAGFSSTALAQTAQPYSGMQSRSIKALSDQQVADLRAGRGMGLALAAELNGYPGPSHVLELADKLGLSADQRARVGQFFESMRQEALPLGS